MAIHMPASVSESPLHKRLVSAGLVRMHQGKVRDTYAIAGSPYLLVVATDRISIFDFVLPATIAGKGEVLTAMTIFWLTRVLGEIPNHLIAYGAKIDDSLPYTLHGNKVLRARALVVRKLDMLPVECIVRGYLTGSGWKSYQTTGEVCGIKLAPGLHDGSQITPSPIFTPTTKAEVGHDEHLITADVLKAHGRWLQDRSLLCYKKIAGFAKQRNIILADTKFEFGKDGTLADEVATPDSSRFWDADQWRTAIKKRTSPESHDKEIVRSWGKKVGIHTLKPENPADIERVDRIVVPPKLLDMTSKVYHLILCDLVGMELSKFQREYMRT